jgi:hypothetical protein
MPTLCSGLHHEFVAGASNQPRDLGFAPAHLSPTLRRLGSQLVVLALEGAAKAFGIADLLVV